MGTLRITTEIRSVPIFTFEFLRSQIVGIDATFETPFGRRLMVYCDYTASGRCLAFVERYLQNLQRIYANTHTEDDLTGRSMSRLLHEAERTIKDAVNAGPGGRIIASFPVELSDQIMLATSSGQSIRTPVEQVSFRSRSAGGVKIFAIGADEEVVSVARVADQGEE